MLKDWQFNILFFVGVGGALFLLLGPEFGLDLESNPTAVTGVGAILTYVLTQRKIHGHRKQQQEEEDEPESLDKIYRPVEEEGSIDKVYKPNTEDQHRKEDGK